MYVIHLFACSSVSVHDIVCLIWIFNLVVGGDMGWCGVGTVIRELIDFSEYSCEYTSLWGKHHSEGKTLLNINCAVYM